MALEAELRSRVDQSLRELEEVVGSLHHVKRLADSEHASAEQLSRVAATMDAAAGQFAALLASVGQCGAVLQSAVEAVRAADPAAVLNRVDAVGQSVAGVGARVDASVQFGEFARGELTTVRTVVESTPAKIEAAARAQAAAVERLEKGVATKIEGAGGQIAALEKRVGAAVRAAWVAAGLALVGAVLGALGFIA